MPGTGNSLGDQLAAARQPHSVAELEDRQWQLEHRAPLTGNLLSLRAFRTQLELDVARGSLQPAAARLV